MNSSDTFTGWCVVPVKSRDSEPGTWRVRYRYQDKLVAERSFADYASALACYYRVLLKAPGTTLLERATGRCAPPAYPGNPQTLNAA